MVSSFGEVSYDDVGSKKDSGSDSKDVFLRLSDGDNEVRLLTMPHQYLVHKYKKDIDNPKDYGQKVSCSMTHGSCVLCESGDKAKARWFYGVIDRKTGVYKLLDVSWAVFSQIKKLAQNAKSWGDPTKYDINIIVDKKGGATGYYSVQPLSKAPLSSSDTHILENIDLEDLKRRCTPLTPEQVQKRIDKINGGPGGDVKTASQASFNSVKPAASKVVQPPVVSMTDDDEDFPDYTA